MKKYTKIVATIGPATCQPKILRGLYEAGMNAARINMSHGDRTSQAQYIRAIRQIDENFPIIMDTKGPEIRTGWIHQGLIDVSCGDELRLVYAPVQHDPDTIPMDYPYLHEIGKGARILFDDGLVESEVIDNNGGEFLIRIMNGGPIGTGKKVTIQGYRVRLPFLTEQDKKDILFAIESNIRLIAASFVRSAEDVRMLRSFLSDQKVEMMIFAKIENSDAVANIRDILTVSDGIMVARGDLGVELPLQEVPGIQNKIIRQCNRAGKPVIVATQMLESMRENPRPTRAEVNDVAHAILQGTDSIMLSAETATGSYPIRSVEMMSLIARQYENQVKGIIKKYRRNEERGRTGIALYIAKAAYYAADELKAKAILTPTESGFTARNVSRFKPKCPILASTKDATVLQLLHLVRGVFPMLDTSAYLDLNHYNMSYQLICHYYKAGTLSKEDRIIITSGSNLMTKRGTNLLEIYAVRDIIEDNPSS
jgi:pyruvate kinase